MSEEYNPDYEAGWNAAFDAIATYVEAEICPVTGQMIRRMKNEAWRKLSVDKSETNEPFDKE